MIRNYLKIAFRNLLQQKEFSFINVFGLSFGLTCCLLIAVYVRYQTSYDQFHQHAKQTYRVVEDIISPREAAANASVAGPVGPALVHDFPEMLKYVRFKSANMLIKYGDKRFQEDHIYFTDSTVFDVFSFRFLKGDPITALAAPYSIVLSKSAAKRYFGELDPIGQTLIVDNENNFKVTGVFEDIPANSHLQFDILISLTTMNGNDRNWTNGWTWSALTYIQLAENYDKKSLEHKLFQFVNRHAADVKLGKDEKWNLSLQPLTQIHLRSKRKGDAADSGSISNVYLFSFVALFILLIACVNFLNLSTGQALRRAKEVGLRKVMGGRRDQITLQFLAESVFISLVSFGFSFALCYLLLPFFSTLIGIPLTISLISSPLAIFICIGTSIIVGCLAGIYPAFILSAFRPADVLKGTLRSPSGGGLLRRGLIVLQFSISMVLIVATVTVFSQLRFMQKQDPGYNKDQMLVLSISDDDLIQKRFQVFKQELLRSPYIDKAAGSSHIPGKEPGTVQVEAENISGSKQKLNIHLLSVDNDFIDLYKIRMVAGQSFANLNGANENFLIVNETVTRKLGFSDPQKMIGKQLEQGGNNGTVIGVTNDFHYTSLHKEIEPLLIRMRSKSISYISIAVRSQMINTTLNDLKKRWDIIAPHRPFEYFFLDEEFNLQYRADRQFGQVFAISSVIAIVLACLGLFALVSLTVQQRTREIGIRKVLGASVRGVAGLLSKDFIKLVLIAIIIATPVSWYAMNLWLQDFAYRIGLQWWIFVLAGLLSIFIALVTVSFKSIKAALMNPVRSLRSE